MGKASAPAAPNYTPIANADAQAATQDFQLAQQQQQWAQQQFNTTWPYAQQYLQSQINSSNTAAQEAQTQEANYNANTLPMIQNFDNTANTYNNPANASQMQGEAEADVANNFNAQRSTAQSQLESYGIDPSQTRFGALDLGTRVSQAAATAAAGTQSGLNTRATGLALQGEGINMGMGLQNSVAQSYATATNAGSSGIGAANNTTATGSNTMGSPIQYGALGSSSLAGETSALNTGFSNAATSTQINNANSANTIGGVGSLIGGALGLGLAGYGMGLFGGSGDQDFSGGSYSP
jgi:hypothetical protein